MAPITNYLKNVFGEDPEIRQTLRKLKSFENASEKLLDIIYQYGKVIRLGPGNLLIKEGDFDQWVYLILKGSLAVYIGDQKFDQVSSALVGERCILGEPRKASLKAEDEVFAFGIDMAMTDVLQNNNAEPGMREAFNELLMILIEHVLERVLYLWTLQSIGFKINSKNLEIRGRQQIIEALANEEFAHRKEIIGFIWWKIKLTKQANPDKFWNAKSHYLNTSKILINYLQNNEHQDLTDLADAIMEWGLSTKILSLNNKDAPEIIEYSEIVDTFKVLLHKHLDGTKALRAINKYANSLFSINDFAKVSLDQLDRLLVKSLVPFQTVSDLWISFIEAALNLNQRLNTNIYKMNVYLGLKEQANKESAILKNTYQRELDASSMEYLQEKLILPYLQIIEKNSKVETPEKAQTTKTMSVKPEPTLEDKPKSVDLSNYDELLAKLGATPGVPLE